MRCFELCFFISKPMGFLVAVSVLISNPIALWSENVAFTTPVVSEGESHAGSMSMPSVWSRRGECRPGIGALPIALEWLEDGSALAPQTGSLKGLFLGNPWNHWVPRVSPAGRGPRVNQGPPNGHSTLMSRKLENEQDGAIPENPQLLVHAGQRAGRLYAGQDEGLGLAPSSCSRAVRPTARAESLVSLTVKAVSPLRFPVGHLRRVSRASPLYPPRRRPAALLRLFKADRHLA